MHMARFTVYANPDASERRHTPGFLDVQNPFIEHLSTRVVIPLRTAKTFGRRSDRLNPLLHLDNQDLVLDTAAIGAVPTDELRKPLGDLRNEHLTIQTALDALFGGY
jgi:toxin CcdB